jgi:DNA-binding transcriptional ArsR family regulator
MLHYSLDYVFHALADSTRRAIVERLVSGPASVSELAQPFAVSLSAIGQHVQLLEACGMVRTVKVGRVRTVELLPDVLALAEGWFASHRQRWERRFDRLGELLDEIDEIDDATNTTNTNDTKTSAQGTHDSSSDSQKLHDRTHLSGDSGASLSRPLGSSKETPLVRRGRRVRRR